MSKNKKKNLICVLLSIMVIAVYILIDGYGIISSSIGFIEASNDAGTGAFDAYMSIYDQFASGMITPSVTHSMTKLYIARLAILFIVLFPILFLTFRYRRPFKGSEGEGSKIKNLVMYFLPVFGLIFFYYILTMGTQFLHEPFTNYYSLGLWLSFFRIILAFVVLCSLIVDWPALFKALKSFPAAHPLLYKAAFVFGISLCSCMLVEFQIGSKMSMTTYMLFFNVFYWLILQVFIDVITRSVKAGAVVSLVLSYVIGLINDIVFQFRGNYVMFGDLTVIRTAMEVAGKYTYKPGFWFWLSIALLITATAVTFILKFPKHNKPKIREIAIRLGIDAGIVVFVLYTFSTGALYNNVFGVGWDYNTNVKYTGYIPYFMSNMNSIKKVTLDGYDASIVDAELEKVSSKEESYKSPNIIIIQNEALADLSVAYDIKTNQDYMPYIHGLTKNTRKGYLNMSITGGPTSNTEFEVLMRSSLGFLPFGCVPYTQYVHSQLPSVAEVLKNQPKSYHTVAYHPYYASGYRRTEVYSHFGFDEAVFEDDFKTAHPKEELIRDLLTDSADYRRVEKMYEEWRKQSSDPWFCFNVTIQNHGGYTQEFTPSQADNVYVTNFEATESINDYLSLVKLSDNAFRELIEYFSKCDEPTIIAMYGDHQPAFEDRANEILKEHVKDENTGALRNYYVPYVIWANYDIEEEDLTGKLNTLSANYFASTVFKYAGIKLTDYDRYLLDLHERVPAITALGVWDSDGKRYSSLLSSSHAGNLATLEMIQYNLIFDDDKRLKKRFS